jgi:hypothetical protein
MPIYKVRVTETRIYKMDLLAESASKAEADGVACVEEGRELSLESLSVEARALVQLGEPWVTGHMGRDRPDDYLGRTNNLLVFDIALGHTFTTEDVALLRRRVETMIGPIEDHWNGAECDTLSIQLRRAFPLLSPEQCAALFAPRPEAVLTSEPAAT